MRNLALILVIIFVIGHQVLANDCKSPCEQPFGLTAEDIANTEVIQFDTLLPNTNLMYDRWYKRVNEQMVIYDAPNGNAIRTLEAGFNFVTVQEEADGWSRINPNEWVQTHLLTDASDTISSFTGILLPETMPQYTIAWSLVNQYPSQQPASPPDESNGMVYRYTPLTIFASETVDGEEWYQIGVDKWVHQHNVARILPTVFNQVETDRWISVDLYEQVLIAYEGQTPVFATLISSGLPRWETKEGVFNIYYRNPREYMSWGTVGDDFYALEEVPWTMFFDEGRALHGAYWHDGFGYRRSHGCVNMSITDAKWLYDWVAEVMNSQSSSDIEVGPQVYVYSSGIYR